MLCILFGGVGMCEKKNLWDIFLSLINTHHTLSPTYKHYIHTQLHIHSTLSPLIQYLVSMCAITWWNPGTKCAQHLTHLPLYSYPCIPQLFFSLFKLVATLLQLWHLVLSVVSCYHSRSWNILPAAYCLFWPSCLTFFVCLWIFLTTS